MPINQKQAQEIIEKEYGISSSYFLDISRLEPHKNVDNLIKANIITRQKYNISQKLVIVGNKVFGYERILALAQHSPYSNDIYFIDYVKSEHLNALYSAAEAFIYPSLNEGFGLPLVEAMASGTPIVTSNITAIP